MTLRQDESEEIRRVAALKLSGVLSAPPNPALDAVTEEARAHFGVSICLLTLIDGDTCWMKSESGARFGSTPRGVAICDAALASDQVLVIEDLSRDPRFSDRGFVAGPPHLRFYAGAPIVYEAGIRFGTVCLMDPTPRRFSRGDRAELGLYADRARSVILKHEFGID